MSMQESIKDGIKKQYAKIALTGNSGCCCTPDDCKSDVRNSSPSEVERLLGYRSIELEAIPEASVLGVGCGAPINFANLKEGETIVDLGSGAGIDVFIAANAVGKKGKVIGIDMTDEMLERARNNAKENGHTNVEFRKGDIENKIPVDDRSIDVVISNCVINITINKVNTFKEINRILKKDGRIIISDLVTDKEIQIDSVNTEKWCSCIEGAITKENYIESIKKAGFCKVEILQNRHYIDGEQVDGRSITSLTIKAKK